MFVLSYPRSGSSYLVNAIHHLQQQEQGYSLNLQEWFNTRSPATWLNVHDQYAAMTEGHQVEIHTLTVKDHVDLDHSQHFSDLLTRTVITSQSRKQVSIWIAQEHARRRQLLAELERRQLAYVIKWFPGSGSAANHRDQGCVMLYRQNFTGCLLSLLIKHHYSRDSLEMAHNHLGRPIPAVAEPVTLDTVLVQRHARIFGQFLAGYARSEPMPTISYEHMMAGGTVIIRGKAISPKVITECYVKQPEQAMDYSLTGTKRDFFTNPEIIPKIIAQAMDQAGVGSVVDQLGIHW
jgi:hypothetical protein